MATLATLIESTTALSEVALYLESLPVGEREREVNALNRRAQARLFDMAADAPPIRLTHFVPADRPDLTAVHHAGRNTIATLPYFQRFEKRFARAAGPEPELVGYNHANARFIRPGYFVAYETWGRPEWQGRGGVVVDYHRVPDGEVPAGWPAVVSNADGLQRLVYHRTRDFMRAVSEGVSIGRASREDAKGDVLLDYWFTLCRLEPAAAST